MSTPKVRQTDIINFLDVSTNSLNIGKPNEVAFFTDKQAFYICVPSETLLGQDNAIPARVGMWVKLKSRMNFSEWMTGESYHVGDTMIYEGALYRANNDHRKLDIDMTDWDLVMPKINATIDELKEEGRLLATNADGELEVYAVDAFQRSYGLFTSVGAFNLDSFTQIPLDTTNNLMGSKITRTGSNITLKAGSVYRARCDLHGMMRLGNNSTAVAAFYDNNTTPSLNNIIGVKGTIASPNYDNSNARGREAIAIIDLRNATSDFSLGIYLIAASNLFSNSYGDQTANTYYAPLSVEVEEIIASELLVYKPTDVIVDNAVTENAELKGLANGHAQWVEPVVKLAAMLKLDLEGAAGVTNITASTVDGFSFTEVNVADDSSRVAYVYLQTGVGTDAYNLLQQYDFITMETACGEIDNVIGVEDVAPDGDDATYGYRWKIKSFDNSEFAGTLGGEASMTAQSLDTCMVGIRFYGGKNVL